MRPENQISRPIGEPMMEIKMQKDAAGNLKIDAWVKDVSPSGIILGNKRPAMPIEIAHFCQMCALNIIAMGLPGVAAGREGGSDGQGAATEPKAN